MSQWRRASTSACILIALCAARPLLAQSVSIDEKRMPPKATPLPAARAKPPPLLVLAPRALSTPIAYPNGAHAEQDVVLELTISAEGAVSAAVAVSGSAPFSDATVAASKAWRFEPATRGHVAVAAKIRFQVHFAPPQRESSTELVPIATPSSSGSARAAPVAPAEAKEILVVGKREPIRHTLGHTDVHDMPGAFGDPYRAIEALPGVVPIVSGLPYFYVRGAPPGNTGYLFDGIPVPYLYHFAAGPGVLQPAFVDHVDLYPGAYPARYGRFAGAIVAGEMAPPSYRLHGEASIRLIDSGAMMEAPFANGRGSAMVGGRFSYTAAVLSLLVPDIHLNYWDYQGRVRYEVAPNDSIELLSFGAGDFLSNIQTDQVSVPSDPNNSMPGLVTGVRREHTVVDVNFHRLDLRWDHRLHAGNWRNALLVGLDRTDADDGRVTVNNHMVGLRSEYQQQLPQGVLLRAGGDALFETLAQKLNHRTSDDAGSALDSSNSDDNSGFAFDRARRDFTTGVWVDTVLKPLPNLEVTPGLRADFYVSGGRSALAFDPRISARFTLTPTLSVTHGLALVHQAPSFVVPIPGFKPSLAGGLQTAVQHSAGLNFALPAGFESSLTLFQNAFFNLTDLISVAQLQNTTMSMAQLEDSTNQSGSAFRNATDARATGHAYGVELLVRRSLARNVGGFISYTLSRSVRSSGNLEGPATTDRTHVLNLALSGNLGKDWRLGGRWLFYSGVPVQVAYVRAAQAPPRTPPFWRLDFKLQKRWYIKRPDAWWGLALEVLNTTFNKEVLEGDCNAFDCTYQKLGPVTVPSIGAEGSF